MVATPAPTRQPRSEARLPGLEEIEQRQQDEHLQSNEDDGSKQPSPEEALAEARQIIAAREGELERERTARAAAEAEVVKASKTAVDARADQIRDQGVALDNAISAAEGRRAAAQAKYKEARANNDPDAEAAALSEISEIGAEVANAKANKGRFDAWKEQNAKRPAPPQQQQHREGTNQAEAGPTAESRKWLGEHPRYYSDKDYQADALAASDRAISLNIPEGSKPYVDYIDGELEKLYGKNHGQIDRKGQNVTQDTRKPRQQPNRSSSAAPPSRGGDEFSGGGDFEYRHSDGSTLRLVTGVDQNGKPYETVTGKIPAEWREFAKINRMKDIEYAVEMLKVEQEKRPGGQYEGLEYNQNGVYKA